MAKKTKATKKAEPKKEVVANPWDGLEGPTKHPDHFGKDIYVKDGVHGYFEDGVFIKV
jgi:hypothetical protein|tara:strand:+ start:1172 stop:1345 length:174 start_codon:yes stop_codon:yes gene_type:complete